MIKSVYYIYRHIIMYLILLAAGCSSSGAGDVSKVDTNNEIESETQKTDDTIDITTDSPMDSDQTADSAPDTATIPVPDSAIIVDSCSGSDTVTETASGYDSDSDSATVVDTDYPPDTDTGADSETTKPLDTENCYAGTVELKVDSQVAQIIAYRCIAGNVTVTGTSLQELSLPNLEWIDGDLIFNGPNVITTLSLPSLKEVTGELHLSGFKMLADFSGIAKPLVVGNGLQIADNRLITTLDDLGGMRLKNGHLHITGNEVLNDLHGLSQITSVSGLAVSWNRTLSTLDGLSISGHVPKGIAIMYNDALQDLSALSDIVRTDALSIVGNAKLVELAGLHHISQTGIIYVDENARLKTLDGLSGLREVLSGIYVGYRDIVSAEGNPALESIVGLKHIENDLFEVVIQHNPSLKSLDGLQFLKHTVNAITIHDNALIETLAGLDNLENVQDTLAISANPSLMSLDVLADVTFENRCAISIADNDALTSLNGLENLTSARSVSIHNNDKLSDLSGLSSLFNISESFSIGDNAVLSSLNKLKNLRSESTHLWFMITNNPQLPYCHICEFYSWIGDFNTSSSVEGNLSDSCGTATDYQYWHLDCP